ncbi:hypothetical protein V8J88_14225 [Massilia sp. W12]|uniref:hypothetical protein n=1 Tax=Massilia sp. W12 TaxID=3126507 RepID=UPI0030D34F16
MMEVKLTWQTGAPAQADLYLVANELNEYSGCYEIASWDGEQWEHDHPENIVAFIRIGDFFKQVKIAWPLPRPEKPEYTKIEGGWDEV